MAQYQARWWQSWDRYMALLMLTMQFMLQMSGRALFDGGRSTVCEEVPGTGVSVRDEPLVRADPGHYYSDFESTLQRLIEKLDKPFADIHSPHWRDPEKPVEIRRPLFTTAAGVARPWWRSPLTFVFRGCILWLCYDWPTIKSWTRSRVQRTGHGRATLPS